MAHRSIEQGPQVLLETHFLGIAETTLPSHERDFLDTRVPFSKDLQGASAASGKTGTGFPGPDRRPDFANEAIARAGSRGRYKCEIIMTTVLRLPIARQMFRPRPLRHN